MNVVQEGNSFYSSLALSCAAAYSLYYWKWVVKKPQLHSNDRLTKFLEKHVPVLTERFYPTIWCVEARCQTIMRSLFNRCKDIKYSRELLNLPDGGVVALDWSVRNLESTNESTGSDRPTIIIMPGLVGTSKESYVLHLVNECSHLNYRCVVFNYRGNGGVELKTPKTYCASDTGDVHEVVMNVKKKYPHSPIMVVGVSLGGIILTNYMARMGEACPIKAGLAVSAPWNVFESSKSLEQPLNAFLFNRLLKNQLLSAIANYEDLFHDKVDFDYLKQSNTISDFDERFTCKIFGYNGCYDYYHAANLDYKVADIKVPLLALNSLDDPFSPGHAIPFSRAQSSTHVAIATTERGGHIAFLDGFLFPHKSGFIERVFSQYSKAIFENGDMLVDGEDG